MANLKLLVSNTGLIHLRSNVYYQGMGSNVGLENAKLMLDTFVRIGRWLSLKWFEEQQYLFFLEDYKNSI